MKQYIADRLSRFSPRAWLPILALAPATATSAPAADNRAPNVPIDIAVPEFCTVHFHAFGVGFQIYTDYFFYLKTTN